MSDEPVVSLGSSSRRLFTIERLKDALVPLGLLPVLAAFLKYAYQAGIAASFHIPLELVRPDLAGVYGLLLLMIPVALLVAIIGIASQPTELFVRAVPAPRPTPLWLKFAGRLYLTLVYAIAASIFFEPLQRMGPMFMYVAEFCALSIIIQAVLFAIQQMTRSHVVASGAIVDDRDPIVRNGVSLGVLGMVSLACALVYGIGFRMSVTETWHYVLPGVNPEVVLLAQTDGYVTAEYQPRTRILSATFRWREWKEHRPMDLIFTGVLPSMTALKQSDDRLFVQESPEPRSP